MARQSSLFKIEGTIDDLNFIKTQDGYLVRRKGGVNRKRYAADPAFQRSRENNAEFGRAGKSGKLLRMAFRTHLVKAADGRMVSRLTKAMHDVLKADRTSTRGLRNVLDGELEMLEGFEFNAGAALDSALKVLVVPSIDRAAGEAAVQFPAYQPGTLITAPAGSTHYRLFIGAAAVNFERNQYQIDLKETALMPVNGPEVAPFTLMASLPANSTHPLFLALGIEFQQELNGQYYPLQNNAFNAYRLVKVSGI
jgi:hypothetical protein